MPLGALVLYGHRQINAESLTIRYYVLARHNKNVTQDTTFEEVFSKVDKYFTSASTF